MPPGSRSPALLYAVVLAEARQTLRDPNTLLFSLGFPLFFLPFALWVVVEANALVTGWQDGIVSVVDAPTRLFRELPESVRRAAPGEAADATIVAEDQRWTVEYRSADPRSALAQRRIEDALIDDPEIQRHDVAPSGEAHAGLFARIVPMLVVFFASLSSMYPAIEAVVADRERGTVETNLVSAAPRWVFAAGKLASVAAVTTLSVVGAVLTTVATLLHFGLTLDIDLGVPFARIVWVLPFAVLAAVVNAAICVAAASPARDFKQAQNFVSTVAIVPMMLASATIMLPRMKLDASTGFVPVLNLVLVMRDSILLGVPLGWTAVAVAEILLLGGIAVAVAWRFLQRTSR